MEGIADQLTSSNTVALVISSIIFIVTVILVSRQLISFLITCVLLFFAIVSGFAIANNDLVRDYLSIEGNPNTIPFDTSENSTLDAMKDKLWGIFEQLVETLSNQEDEDTPENREQAKASVKAYIHTLDEQKAKLEALLKDSNSTGKHNRSTAAR